jgi:predicted CoA-binding protein
MSKVEGELVESEAGLVAIVREMKNVAVLGIKNEDDPDAPAFSIPRMLDAAGIPVLGINPRVPMALGRPTLSNLSQLPPGVDVLNVFRNSSAIPAHADELLALPPERRPRVIWLQTGIRNDAAAAKLVAGGYRVVQDACLGVYSRRAGRR